MQYKERDIPTGIHTRINDRVRISSAWRTFGNENFTTRAWETLLWVDEHIAEQYDTLRNAENVIDLHLEITNDYLNEKPKAIESTEHAQAEG